MLIPKLALVISSLVTVAVFSFPQDRGHPVAKKAYVRSGQEVTLSGTITLAGKRPRPRIIDTSADSACFAMNQALKTESAEGRRGGLANVFVYVKSDTLDALTFEPPSSAATLEHKGCRYQPHVLGIQLGQQLMIYNRDDTFHNTHPTPKKNPEWNQTQPPGAPPLTRMLELPETFIPFKDNQHPWEKAYVGVFTHPFFAISDQNGNFKIEGLPAGSYTVIAWHERFGEKTTNLVFVPGEMRHLSFNFEITDEANPNRFN